MDKVPLLRGAWSRQTDRRSVSLRVSEGATVFVARATGGVFQEHPADVDRYETIFERLRAMSLPAAESINLVSQMARASKGAVVNIEGKGHALISPTPYGEEQPVRTVDGQLRGSGLCGRCDRRT